eukprot:21771-Prymnesium_polylepis.1
MFEHARIEERRRNAHRDLGSAEMHVAGDQVPNAPVLTWSRITSDVLNLRVELARERESRGRARAGLRLVVGANVATTHVETDKLVLASIADSSPEQLLDQRCEALLRYGCVRRLKALERLCRVVRAAVLVGVHLHAQGLVGGVDVSPARTARDAEHRKLVGGREHARDRVGE